MVGFIVRRLLSAILVLLLTTLAVFVLFYKGPSNPAQGLCDAQQRCTQEKLANLEHAMGLDKAIHVAYGDFLKGLVSGREISFSAAEKYDCSAPCLGISYETRTEVSDELASKYPATLSLAIGGAVIYLFVGVLLGVLAARFRDTIGDKLLVSSTLIVSAIPYYVVALLAWIFLTQKWSIFDDDLLPTLRQSGDLVRRHAAAVARARPDQRHVVLPVHPGSDDRDDR